MNYALKAHSLLQRLEEIGHALAQSDHALALIGLGSVGQALHRLDAYSDLDFFVIVEPGHKRAYLEDLRWLSDISPVAFHFANTRDGYKLLFADGIFCEFAIFEAAELSAIPFAPGRIVWKRPDASETLSQPVHAPSAPQAREPDWLLGEALTNLYVGLARNLRGEKLSAARFIQGYAVDKAVELAEFIHPTPSAERDIFAPERRFEQRHSAIAGQLAAWMQGYERNPQSALALLAFLEEHFDVNQAMAAAIRRLCAPI